MLEIADEDLLAYLIKYGEEIRPILYLIKDNIKDLTSKDPMEQRDARNHINNILAFSGEDDIYILPGKDCAVNIDVRDSYIAHLYPSDESYIFKLSDLIGDEFLYVND